MAKEDFCFTYYDGDAARDMAHMNRLERGGYGDLIISLRKFGHLSLSRIKKTLGSDFENIWESIEIVLSVDAQGNYFIEWLENSLEKMKRQSLKQSENGKRGGRPAKPSTTEINPNKTQINPIQSELKPLGIVYGNEIEKEEEGTEEKFFPDKTLAGVELTVDEFDLTMIYVETTTKSKVDAVEVERMWKGFKIQYFTGKNSYGNWEDVIRHFRDWLKNQVMKNAARGTPYAKDKPVKNLMNEFYEARQSQLR